MSNTVYLDIEQFDLPEFYVLNRQLVEQYADLRVRAIHSHSAFRRVFGGVNCTPIDEMMTRIQALEASAVYNEAFDTKLKVIPLDQILDERKALHGYLEIASNPLMREAVRVAAMKEAAVLAGITVIDEQGRTKRMPTLEELYSAFGKGGDPADDRPTLSH